jgi:hypothetical protein
MRREISIFLGLFLMISITAHAEINTPIGAIDTETLDGSLATAFSVATVHVSTYQQDMFDGNNFTIEMLVNEKFHAKCKLFSSSYGKIDYGPQGGIDQLYDFQLRGRHSVHISDCRSKDMQIRTDEFNAMVNYRAAANYAGGNSKITSFGQYDSIPGEDMREEGAGNSVEFNNNTPPLYRTFDYKK